MSILISVFVALFLLVAFVVILIIAVAGGFAMMRSRSMVPRTVRKRLLADLDSALAEEQIETLQRKWMTAKGWVLDES